MTLWAVRSGLVGVLLAFTSAAAFSASPNVTSLSLRGLQAGGVTSLTIVGSDLLPEPKLISTVPIARQTLQPGAMPNQIRIDVGLDASVVPGIYPVWLATSGGVSSQIMLAVDALPQLPFISELTSLPVALTGNLQDKTVLRTSFQGTKGQKLVVDVEGRRLGGSLNPILRLYDSRNVQLAYSPPRPALFGDSRLSLELPADDRYAVELHDALFRGAAPGLFRLKLGALQFADLTYPLAGQRGAKPRLEFAAGNLPPGAATAVDVTTLLSHQPVPWPAAELFTGAQPRLVVSELEEILEKPIATNAKPDDLQSVTAPAAINGRLTATGEEDRFKLAVKPGQKLRFDVLASRAGSSLDGILTLSNLGGGQLATSDDRPGTSDPGLDFTVPAGTESVLLSIKDINQRGGPDFIYRIAISLTGEPDFSLTLVEDRLQLPLDGYALLRVRTERTNYTGPIKLDLAGLPKGVIVTGQEIPAGATDTLLSFGAGPGETKSVLRIQATRSGYDGPVKLDLSGLPPRTKVTGAEIPAGASEAVVLIQEPGPSPQAGLISIVGEAEQSGVKIRRPVQLAETLASKYQPWLRGQLAAAVTEPGPLTVAWAEASAGAKLPLGAALPAPVQITRSVSAAGAVRLSLITSQRMPQKSVQNPQTKQTTMADDLDRSLRFDGSPTIPGDKTSLVAQILVPGDLPPIPYDLAILAELLSPDGKAVLASAVTPARRISTVQPFTLELAGPGPVEAKAGSGETGSLTGKVVRAAEFSGPVTVTLAGLPEGFPPPKVELPSGKAEFALPISFPYGAALGPLQGIKLTATSGSDPAKLIRSNEIPVQVKVVAGGPPPALHRVFDDETALLSYFKPGEGQIAVESSDRFSGSTSVKVTGLQVTAVKLPGLGLKIAEKPGDGEYRYLRFAWKKRGGANVLLRLSANGSLDLKRVTNNAPTYAYEAGDGSNKLRAPAIRLSEKLPTEWTVVTRDLFADFGAFQLDGLALVAGDGEFALFDHIYLGRSEDDFKDCPKPIVGDGTAARP